MPTFSDYMAPVIQGNEQLSNALMSAAQQENERTMQQRSLYQQLQQFGQEMAFRRQQQQDTDNQNLAAALSAGGKAVDANGNVSVTAPTATQVSDPSSGAGSISPDGTLQMNPNQTGLMQSLNMAGGAQVALPADRSQVVSIGGRQVQVPTQQQNADAALANETARYNIGTVPVTQEMSDATGGAIPVGMRIPVAHAALITQSIKAYNQANKQPAPKFKDGGYTADGRPITFEENTGTRTVGAPIPGMAAPPPAGKQLAPYEQWQQNRQAKQDADQAEYNGVLNDVLTRANGDPVAARKLAAADATASKDNPAKRQLAPVIRQLISLQGKPDETQALLAGLNQPSGSTTPAPAPSASGGFNLFHPSTWGGGSTSPAPAAPAAPTAPAASAPTPQAAAPMTPAKTATRTTSTAVPALPRGNGQKISTATAQQFMAANGNNPAKARQQAQQYDWKF